MYMDRCVEVSKATNGYVISCNVPLKPDAKKTEKMSYCCDPSANRQYIAKDAKEVADLIGDILPLLDETFKTEDEFDTAFQEAANDIEANEKEE